MKRIWWRSVPAQAVIVVGVEMVARHVAAGTSLVGSILAGNPAAAGWGIPCALALVVLRLFAVWVFPALVVAWMASRVWRGTMEGRGVALPEGTEGC